MGKNQISLFLPEELFDNLDEMTTREVRSLSLTTTFIFKSYLENPQNFDFSKRKWTSSAFRGARKKVATTFRIDSSIYQELKKIHERDGNSWTHFLRGILDVYFIDNPIKPEYPPTYAERIAMLSPEERAASAARDAAIESGEEDIPPGACF